MLVNQQDPTAASATVGRHQIRPRPGERHHVVPRQIVTPTHLTDRHRLNVSDELTGQPPCHVSAAANDELGMVLPMPLIALATHEPAANPGQLGRPAPSWQITHPQPTGVVNPAGLEPAMWAADNPAGIGDLDHQAFDQIHQHRDHAHSTQVQTNGHSIRTHQSPFLARRFGHHRVSRGSDHHPGIHISRRLPTSPRSLKKRHRLNPRGNRILNHVLHIAAVSQLRYPGEGRTYYDKKIAEGKTTKEAIRALKRRISDVVYRRLLADARRRLG